MGILRRVEMSVQRGGKGKEMEGGVIAARRDYVEEVQDIGQWSLWSWCAQRRRGQMSIRRVSVHLPESERTLIVLASKQVSMSSTATAIALLALSQWIMTLPKLRVSLASHPHLVPSHCSLFSYCCCHQNPTDTQHPPVRRRGREGRQRQALNIAYVMKRCMN